MVDRISEVYLIDQIINDMFNLVEWLKGKKTYFMALGVAVVAFAQYMGWLSNEAAVMLYGLLGAGGVATMRAAIAKNA